MNAQAVIFEGPKSIKLSKLEVNEMVDGDVEIEVAYTGISTGTERLLWEGSMPNFPGMGYPLVPGYEAVGQITKSHSKQELKEGDYVFVPGAYSFKNVRNLFGGSGSRLVVPADRVISVSKANAKSATLLALAATAYHSVSKGGALNTAEPPDLIIGHGIMGRLLARMTVAAGMPAPTVWEINPARMGGAQEYGYSVVGVRVETAFDKGIARFTWLMLRFIAVMVPASDTFTSAARWLGDDWPSTTRSPMWCGISCASTASAKARHRPGGEGGAKSRRSVATGMVLLP